MPVAHVNVPSSFTVYIGRSCCWRSESGFKRRYLRLTFRSFSGGELLRVCVSLCYGVMDVRTVQIIYSRILFRNLRFKGLSLSTGLLLRLLVRSTSMGWLLRNTGCGVWGTGNNKYIGSLVWTMLNSQMIWWILQAKHEIITRCMTDCWTILTDPAITVEIHESHFCHWHAQAWSH